VSRQRTSLAPARRVCRSLEPPPPVAQWESGERALQMARRHSEWGSAGRKRRGQRQRQKREAGGGGGGGGRGRRPSEGPERVEGLAPILNTSPQA